jgi:trehalose 6-phosphate synthase
VAGLVVCSHRGPVAYHDADGVIAARTAGPGGLVAVVAPALERLGGTWIFAPSTDVDRELARRRQVAGTERVRHEIVDLPPAAHDAMYRVVYTDLLVPLFHYLLDLARQPAFDAALHRAWDDYRAVNRLFGEAIARHDDARGVLVEDAHLMLAGAAARGAGANGPPLTYFHHLPWCDPEYLGVLPPRVRDEILAGLLAFDGVAFHTRRWLEAFAACCERFLPAARRDGDAIACGGRTTRLAVIPVAIDADATRATAEGEAARRWRERLAELCGDRRAVVRVERADPSKNAVRAVQAYGELLDRRPELAAQTCLLAVMTRVRTWSEPYRRYLAEAEEAAAAIGERHGRDGAPPVVLHLSPDPHEFDHHRAIGALAGADTVLVTPTYDGLNIVALEGVIVGEPAVVLSRNAGAYELIGEHAIGVNPFDVSATASAIERALELPAGERRERARAARAVAAARRPEDWVAARLAAAT